MAQWSKGNELEYLKSLINGTLWRGRDHQPSISTEKLLRNYIESAKKRIAWGTFVSDGEEVVEYAEAALQRLR